MRRHLLLAVLAALPLLSGRVEAMCGGNVFATCKPRTPAVAPAKAAEPARSPARRKTRPSTLRR